MNEERHSMAANNEMKQMLELSDSYVKAITIKKKKKKNFSNHLQILLKQIEGE